jgi:oligopeptide transport system ATP-binding protein
LGMSMIWITHDLGVIAGLAERVLVMYAGFIVEEAGVEDLYEQPQHPYTIALLAALPRVDHARHSRLKSIRGAPPNLLIEPLGCPFAARCEYTFDRCSLENPKLVAAAPGHSVACWFDVGAGKAR